MPKLYSKVEIQGVIKHISDYKESKSGVPYMNGLIQTFTENEGKRGYYTTIAFATFNKVAENLRDLGLKKNEVVRLLGSLQENTYKDKITLQLSVSSVVGVDSSERYAFATENQRDIQVDPYHIRADEEKFEQKSDSKAVNPYADAFNPFD